MVIHFILMGLINMTKQKIQTLLNSIRCDLFHLQEKLKLEGGSVYFSPAHDAFEIVERDTKNAVTFIDQFTPPKQRVKKYNWILMELVNLDKHKILTDQVRNYEE